MTDVRKPSVGVLGAGPVGLGIATLLTDAGYDVLVGSRNPGRRRRPGLVPGVELESYPVAARQELIVLAVAHNASRDLVESLSESLEYKVLIDTDNAWIPSHYAAAGLSRSITEGTWMSRLLPRSSVVRAFSHIDADKLVPYASTQPGRWAAAFAADDPDAAARAAVLIRDCGYVPLLVGTLRDSAAIDPGGALWARMIAVADVTRADGRLLLPLAARA